MKTLKKFHIGETYKHRNGKKFKVVDMIIYGSKCIIELAPVKGCVCYKKESFPTEVVTNQASKIDQVMLLKSYDHCKIWLRATDRVDCFTTKQYPTKCLVSTPQNGNAQGFVGNA